MKKSEINIESHIGLVHSCCKRFKSRGIEYDDLFSSGCLGLVKAFRRFDESRNCCFSKYAVPVILGEIKQLFRDSGTVKVGRSLKELSIKAKKISEDYLKLTGNDISINTLAEKLEVTAEKASEALNCSKIPLSLTMDYDNEDSMIEIPVESEEEKLTEHISLNQAIYQLNDSDRNLIQLRYYKHKTQTEAAKELGMTQVQVSRREKKILLSIRHKLSV